MSSVQGAGWAQWRGLTGFIDFLLGTASERETVQVEPLQLATCTVLMETARVDDDITPEEEAHVRATLQNRFNLSAEEMERLLIVSAQKRDETADLWPFTHEINERCTKEEKIQLMEDVWRVIYLDGTLARHEDHIAHKLARLLNLDHPEMIQAKLRVLEESRGD